MSGSRASIFALEGSKKWIIRDGVTGISRTGSGAPMASGAKWERGLRIPFIMAARRPGRRRLLQRAGGRVALLDAEPARLRARPHDGALEVAESLAARPPPLSAGGGGGLFGEGA